MAKCVISGVAPGGGGVKIVTGSFTVPAKQTGLVVDFGIVPKFFILSGTRTTSLGDINVAGAVAMSISPGKALKLYIYDQRYQRIVAELIETGFFVKENIHDTDETYYYFAIG